jgi:putative DNA methylase
MMTRSTAAAASPRTLTDAESGSALSFMEVQFPVSKLSKESYKERKANHGQTLTGLGKWWGRKPLVLCRATILGLLMPASKDPKRDREIFLKLMTMDDEGLWERKNKSIEQAELYARLPARVRDDVFSPVAANAKPRLRSGLTREDKERLQRLAFESMSYDEKLAYCCRPEEIGGPSPEAWKEINAHLGTKAKNLPELVAELGRRRFGHVPRVGDAFCGGGSVPFEAARLGCDAYGSDLNPVAALLTWAALNIVGGGPEIAEAVRKAQREVFEAVDRQVTEWGIEHNEKGWRADAYLYCIEARCPECGWMVPLAPSWVIGEKSRCVAKLVPNPKGKRFDIAIHSRVSDAEMRAAKAAGTAKDANLVCPNSGCQPTPIKSIRGDRGDGNNLRPWENQDLVPRPDDIFQERLYCVRWVKTIVDEDGNPRTVREYRAVDEGDRRREAKVLKLLRDRFEDWQAKGYIPSRTIDPGDETTRLKRERGWTRWHHLFNPRQLLILGAFAETSEEDHGRTETIANLLALGRCTDRDSRLSIWDSSAGNEKVANAFLNQALNTSSNYGLRPVSALSTPWNQAYSRAEKVREGTVEAREARAVRAICDLWITDPPYADAVNYHELSEFFLSWYSQVLNGQFPEWYSDSKRALSIKGNDAAFTRSMVESALSEI